MLDGPACEIAVTAASARRSGSERSAPTRRSEYGRETAMATATADMARGLDTAARQAESIHRSIDRYHAEASVFALSFSVLPLLYRMQKGLKGLQGSIASLRIETGEDRELAKEMAGKLAAIAAGIDSVAEKYNGSIGTMQPLLSFLGSINARLFEEVACAAEDAAETLALASDTAFANLLESDLTKAHGRA